MILLHKGGGCSLNKARNGVCSHRLNKLQSILFSWIYEDGQTLTIDNWQNFDNWQNDNCFPLFFQADCNE